MNMDYNITTTYSNKFFKAELKDNGVEDKKTTTYSNKFFKGEFKEKKYPYSKFEDVGVKEAHFIDCDFSFCYFNRCYFHKVTFEKCNFTGCLFNQCTIRNSHFKGCDIKYSRFFQTILPDEELIANLPDWPNVRLELLQNLRLNAQNTGNTKGIRVFLIEELEANRMHYLKVAKGKEDYYRNKYKGVFFRLNGWCKYYLLWIDKYTWGHGERPIYLIASIVLSILISTLLITIGNSDKLLIGKCLDLSYLWNTIKSITGFFFGINTIPDAPWIMKLATGGFKLFFMGVLINVLLRFLAKR